MKNLKSPLSIPPKIPPKWQERFLIKRIGEADIDISLEERNAILRALKSGTRYIQIGKYTIMINSIKSIDPKYGDKNIPPRPKLQVVFKYEDTVARPVGSNVDEVDEYDAIFNTKPDRNEEKKRALLVKNI